MIDFVVEKTRYALSTTYSCFDISLLFALCTCNATVITCDRFVAKFANLINPNRFSHSLVYFLLMQKCQVCLNPLMLSLYLLQLEIKLFIV